MAVFKIYVGNLSYNTTEQRLKEMFQLYGPVEDVAIARNKETGQSRGFGFVFMSDEKLGRMAIGRVNRQRVDGRRIVVLAADKKKSKEQGGKSQRARPIRGRGARRGTTGGNIRVYRSSDDRKAPF